MQTAWWGSSSTNATRANNTAATPRPRLRGLAPVRVQERGEAGGVRVEAGGPMTDSTTGVYSYMWMWPRLSGRGMDGADT